MMYSQEPNLADTTEPSSVVAQVPVVPSATNTSVLGAAVRADFEALQNDFEQANALAVDLQSQLEGKSNEFVELKRLFEKTMKDLAHLQSNVAELREERHNLANAAMRATALEQILPKITSERDQLKLELESVRLAQSSAQVEMNRTIYERDERIKRLLAEIAATSKPTSPLRQPLAPQRSGSVPNPGASAIIANIYKSLEQLQAAMEMPRSQPPPAKPQSEPEFIDISFST